MMSQTEAGEDAADGAADVFLIGAMKLLVMLLIVDGAAADRGS